MKRTSLLVTVIATALLAGCDIPPSSREIEAKKQEEMSKQAIESVGMPAVTNYAEKRMMKDIIELRDRMQPTYTYIVDMNGKYHKVCDSLGYGLPYATQYTNPQMRVSGQNGNVTLPQADPNGLYSPASADGTWVLCLDPTDKKTKPVYIEPRVIVSPIQLQ